MKKILLPLLFLALTLLSCNNRPKTIEQPYHGLRNTSTVEIDRIELTDSSTVLYMQAYFRPHNWIRIGDDTYLKANGEKYMIKAAEGIEIAELHWMPENGRDSFVLFFPALPEDIEVFDFIEGDCDDCFKIWDVSLKRKPNKYESLIPAKALSAKQDKNAPLSAVEIKSGKTKINFHPLGLKEGYVLNQPVLYVNDFFLRDQIEYNPVENEDGSYTFDFDLNCTTTVFLFAGNSINVIVEPGETAEVYVDYAAASQFNSRYHPQKNIKYVGFEGKYAAINLELSNSEIQKYYEVTNVWEDDVLAYSLDEWFARLQDLYGERRELIRKNSMTAAAKQYLLMGTDVDYVSSVMEIPYYYERAYRTKNNLDYRTPIDYEVPEATDEMLMTFTELNLNDPDYLYQASYTWVAGNLVYNLSEEKIDQMTGTEQGLLQDTKKVISIMNKADNMMELTDEEEQIFAGLSIPMFREVFDRTFAESKRKYEEAMSQSGYEIKETPNVADEKIVEAIIAQYKGKPVFIDIWATWCGPCVHGMKVMKPFKPTMEKKGVVCVYIAGENSPKNRWISMLPDIGGIHYRLTAQQWDVMRRKYEADGVPTYMIANKEGKIVYKQVGFPGVDAIKAELEKVW